MSKLEDILQNEVAAEIGAIAAEAEARARTILASAQQKAEALKSARERQLEAEYQAALRRAESAADLTVNQARIAARGKVVDQVKAEAIRSLLDLTGRPEFGQTLQKLAEEALAEVGQAEALVLHPNHASLLADWAKSRGLELRTDPAIRDGVRLVAKGGRSFVQNALSERLERAWDALSAKAAKAIWG
ncbi:V-type ATP synthase subunit E [Meiothermus sp. CFH 77666]|uniref:V-type ATP synthase subunit E n=1 Tax=Meiothermus sp. CFH 77666 TaxID=2817942 RepID=UPI001AA029AC|nr:V-type ATP synthase subunit E [Meiothermus sp. CFH 77666]MBO1437566.1 V-type ATP synthase subunit E [Meiothermus sp. CFH 77666]